MLCEENYIQVACKYGNLIERQKWAGAIYSALNGTDDIILERLLWWKEKFSNAEITQEIVKNAFKNINKIPKLLNTMPSNTSSCSTPYTWGVGLSTWD